MRAYFDSSVLIAAFVQEEKHHERAVEALANSSGFTSTHALAEMYGTLTSGRLPIRLTPEEAIEMIEQNVLARMEILELSLRDYRAALAESKANGARGGAVYHLLHLQAARRGQAKRILTLNIRHFQSFAPDLKEIITEP